MTSPLISFKTLVLSALVASSLLFSNSAAGAAVGRDPAIPWAQIETEHFLIVYDSRQQSLGEMYARQAEQAFAAVS
ncbi:MAG: hypothetical protein V4760_01515, partial [Bdellovibrionota bacterium]